MSVVSAWPHFRFHKQWVDTSPTCCGLSEITLVEVSCTTQHKEGLALLDTPGTQASVETASCEYFHGSATWGLRFTKEHVLGCSDLPSFAWLLHLRLGGGEVRETQWVGRYQFDTCAGLLEGYCGVSLLTLRR